ncbi:MAG: Na+/H+ antiporter NhaC [Flavobacteriales bacterium]|nr:Na+/H+ antiporter NhaC [Flavobacteriia bacterium]
MNQSFFGALLPIIFLIALLSFNVYLYGDDSLGGANQLALLLSAAFATIMGLKSGTSWKSILKGVSNSIASTTPAIIILLLIGSLAGTWLISGIVPTMIYYGLQILNPKIFLVAAAIICAIVSLASGSSWSTIATVGIALLGIGNALDISNGLTAGAIISGAYFGDKMSPLSDTTNLAPAMAGTDLFTHIRYMMYTTIPSFVISLLIFLFIGLSMDNTQNSDDITNLLMAIESSFNISPWLFLVPVIVLLLIMKKVPALPALFAGTLLGGIFAIIFQPHLIIELSGIDSNFFQASYVSIINAMGSETSINTSNEMINDLLSSGGMYGMLNTIWLIICAMCFGGVMEASGALKKISQSIIQYAESTGSVIATTACTCLFFNVTASDQYLSIVVPGRMYADTFKDKGLAPENLSRTLEDSGTVTSVLVPWNTCGATQSAVLGVATMTYLPFCFFNIISPLMTILYGYLGFKIKKIKS